MDKAKLRRFMFMKDKQSGMSGNAQSMPSNKSAAKSMSPGLSNPMGMHPGFSKPPGIKENLPNPTSNPTVIGQQPKLPKMAKFGKTKSYFKK